MMKTRRIAAVAALLTVTAASAIAQGVWPTAGGTCGRVDRVVRARLVRDARLRSSSIAIDSLILPLARAS
jgi:hypothetical protein